MEIFLIRHTNVNIDKNICYGQTDVDLSNTFVEELNIIKNKITYLTDIVFFSSPLKRCSILADSLSNSNYTVDERLIELNFGNWELINWGLLENGPLQEWIDDPVNFQCPGGESFNDLYNRSKSFYEELILTNYSRVAIITHAGVIRSILSHILEMPLNKSFVLKLDFGSISRIEINGQLTTVSFINK